MQTSHNGQGSVYTETVFILAHDIVDQERCEAVLARVGTLPVLLRAILGAQHKCPIHTVIVLNSITGPALKNVLRATKRLPDKVEWMLAPAGTTFSTILRRANVRSGRVVFIASDRTYHPVLHQTVSAWNGASPGIDFVSSGASVGLFALSHEMAMDLAAETVSSIVTTKNLHDWMERYARRNILDCSSTKEISVDSWHIMRHADDRVIAEQKLEHWLVKPTDGVFARFNRRISIPISRQLIKLPITPNMVSLFTLGISLAAGALFTLGGYWACLLGAVLSLLASILDGCDGEVARLKMQVSDFGCWLDSICDYLYYFVTFAGMSIGLMRSEQDSSFLGWGIAICAGAIITFMTTLWGRKWLTHGRPEQYLAIWQKKAETRSAGVLVNIGRYTEFIVRRCFLPYLILLLAIFNLTRVTVYMAAVGANVAWIISLRSLIVLAKSRLETGVEAAPGVSGEEKPDRIAMAISSCPRSR